MAAQSIATFAYNGGIRVISAQSEWTRVACSTERPRRGPRRRLHRARFAFASTLLATVLVAYGPLRAQERITLRVMLSHSAVGKSVLDTTGVRRTFTNALAADSMVEVLPPNPLAGLRIRAAQFVAMVDVAGRTDRPILRVNLVDMETTIVTSRDAIVLSSSDALLPAADSLGRQAARRLAAQPARGKPPRRP
jgi:hypothetical protein